MRDFYYWWIFVLRTLYSSDLKKKICCHIDMSSDDYQDSGLFHLGIFQPYGVLGQSNLVKFLAAALFKPCHAECLHHDGQMDQHTCESIPQEQYHISPRVQGSLVTHNTFHMTSWNISAIVIINFLIHLSHPPQNYNCAYWISSRSISGTQLMGQRLEMKSL